MQPAPSPDERRSAILALLANEPRLAVGDLAARFGTSEDSVRRDLRQLAAEGRIRRVHGAVLPAAPDFGPPEARRDRDAAAKARIAALACHRLRPGSTVFLDNGTTIAAVAAALPRDIRLTVVTASLAVAAAIADHPFAECIVIGGRLDPGSRSVVGGAAAGTVGTIGADLFLFSPCAVDAGGYSVTGYEEAQIKRAMIASAGETVALATHDKLSAAATHRIADLAAVGCLVTDRSPPAPLARALSDRGTEVLIPES